MNHQPPSGVLYEIEGKLFVVKDFSDLIQRHLATRGLWEPELVGVLKSVSRQIYARSGKCHLVNVGAHIGSVSVACASGCSRISAFEPVKSNFEHLNLHRDLNRLEHMRTYNVALSDSEYESKIVFNPKNTGGCHVVSDEEVEQNIRHAGDYVRGEAVQCVSMDSIEFEESIDILLVDIEGHEERFLRGAKETIKKYLPVVIIELWTDTKRRHENMQKSQSEMIQSIVSLGYIKVARLGVDTFIFYN